MRSVPASERPRERLVARGVDALSERELLALVLRNGTTGASALDLADALLAQHGSLTCVAGLGVEELAAQSGVGPAKAAAVVAAFALGRRLATGRDLGTRLRTPADVAAIAAPILAVARRERVLVLVCDGANRLRRVVPVSEGSVDRAPVPVREILNAVLRHDGRAFALTHNHPSGDPEPSDADHRATAAVLIGASAAGLRFLGHVVVAGDEWRPVS